MRVAVQAALLVTVTALAGGIGCIVDVDYAPSRFQCRSVGTCPPGQECVDRVCVPVGQIADGAPSDAPLPDAPPPPDAAPPDGPPPMIDAMTPI